MKILAEGSQKRSRLLIFQFDFPDVVCFILKQGYLIGNR